MLPAMVVLPVIPVILPKGEGGWCFCRRRGGGGRVCVLLWEQSAERNFWFLLFLQQTITIGNISFTKTRTFLEIFNTLFSLPLISGRFCLRDFWPLFRLLLTFCFFFFPKNLTRTHTQTQTHTRARRNLSRRSAHTHARTEEENAALRSSLTRGTTSGTR